MDPVQASSEEFIADIGSSANKKKERTKKKNITESNSDDQVMKHSSTRSNKTSKKEKEKKEVEEVTKYLRLYKATLEGDWKSAEGILNDDANAMTAKITWARQTVLHVAASVGHAIQFVEELRSKVPKELLELQDRYGHTALSYAARVGNTKAAELLVDKDPHLLWIRTYDKNTPLHVAAKYGHKETIRYLLKAVRDKERDEEQSLFTGKSGVRLLNFLIVADFYDIALDLLKKHPELAVDQDKDGITAFITLAQKPHAFASGSHLGYWQRIIYYCIPVEMDNVPPKPREGGDEENPNESSQKCLAKFTHHRFLQQIATAFGKLCGKVHVMLWRTIKQLVPSTNHIHEDKLMHKRTLELVELMCAEVTSSGENAKKLLETPLFIATRLGICEVVAEIIKTYPHAIWFRDVADNRHVFQLAVLHRHEKIFSLLYQMGCHKLVLHSTDKLGNILHLAGTLEPSNRVSGAALQMQRELQWFKEIEKCVPPSFKEDKLRENTPRMLFTEKHKELVKQGEEWMKTTATSCTVVAALIATMVFTAAFTVPGGNDSDQGIPIFLHELSFMVFAISDAVSLFSSTTSLLMFLGILTSRYSQEDFFISLPRKLIIGLITLFISIASMVIAFSATLYILLAHRFNLVVIPIALLACLPVTFFAFLQFPLLVEIFLSTYGPNIFHQQSEDIIFF